MPKSLLSVYVAALMICSWGIYEWKTIRQERRLLQEEAILKNVDLGRIDLKDKSFEQAVQLLVEKFHKAGHPEVEAQIFTNGRDVPFFHARNDANSPFAPPNRLTKEVFTSSAKYVLDDFEKIYRSGLGLRGHDLIAVKAHGTVERFHKVRFRTYGFYFGKLSDEELVAFLGKWNMPRYEGMNVEVRRSSLEIVVEAPEENITFFRDILDGDVRPSRWSELRSTFVKWRVSFLGF